MQTANKKFLEFPSPNSTNSRNSSMDDWMFSEWRKVSIPPWRRILAEARERGQEHRAEYAEWMLRDILKEAI